MADQKEFRSRVMDLESPIRDAKNAVSLMNLQLDKHFTRSHEALTKHTDYWYLSADDIDDLIFTARLLSQLVGKTIKDWEGALEVME
ncbi:hypothetical protein [Ochrobactrum sp. S1502_03]|uniref:hypothetical protein n=1 Tax=Ochrobactrum sp. S1502_03 TaxID=3108451 RepID=UPI0037CC5AA2